MHYFHVMGTAVWLEDTKILRNVYLLHDLKDFLNWVCAQVIMVFSVPLSAYSSPVFCGRAYHSQLPCHCSWCFTEWTERSRSHCRPVSWGHVYFASPAYTWGPHTTSYQHIREVIRRGVTMPQSWCCDPLLRMKAYSCSL